MKVSEALESTADILSAVDVAEMLSVNAQSIRDQAKTAPAMLGFPVAVIGTTVKIPRVAFLLWMGYRPEQINGLPVGKRLAP